MENPTAAPPPENEQNVHEFFRNLLSQRDDRLRQMVEENNRLRAENARSKPSASPPSDDQSALLLAGLRAENERLRNAHSLEKNELQNRFSEQSEALKKLRVEQSAAANAPIPKKGISRAGLLFLVLLAAILGFWGHKLMSNPVLPNAAVFEKYRDQRLFQFEYDLNQGQFSKVEETLNKDLAATGNAPIQAQIEFVRKLVRASGRAVGGEKSAAYVELNSKPAPAEKSAPEPTGKQKTLTITEETLTLRHEATKTSAAITKLKKGQVCIIIDRTLTRDKVKATIDGNPYELKDYWFKVEVDDLTGWVFGFYTNKSHDSKTLLDSAGKPVVQAASEPSPQAIPIPSN